MPYLKLGVAALALAGGTYSYIRIDTLKSAVHSRDIKIEGLEERNELYVDALDDREKRIADQNQSIIKLAQAGQAGRTIYLQDYARADQQAQSHDDHAAELLAIQGQFTDELAECRAAKTLLQEELIE